MYRLIINGRIDTNKVNPGFSQKKQPLLACIFHCGLNKNVKAKAKPTRNFRLVVFVLAKAMIHLDTKTAHHKKCGAKSLSHFVSNRRSAVK
jgi:hypothetical protein